MFFSVLIGKIIIFLSKAANRNGSTWPGHIVLKINPNFLKKIIANNRVKIVLVAGTNGKTTTSSIIATILKGNKKTIFQNKGGANLKNGIASAFVAHASLAGKINYEYAVLEADENSLPLILKDITPHSI